MVHFTKIKKVCTLMYCRPPQGVGEWATDLALIEKV
jgi:hypothetical protein